MAKGTISKRVALSLKRHGVTEIFGQSNPPTIMLEANALGIRQIGFRQENSGAYMAHGYTMGSKEGKIGVVAAQNGPAATLLVPGLAECLKASIPVVALVQDTATEAAEKNAFQELDHVKLYEGVSKWVRRLPGPSRVEDFVDMAFVAASSGRPGPAVLLLPTEMLFDTTEYEYQEDLRDISYGTYPLDRVMADPAQITKAAEMLAKAKAPIIYAGGGVISSGASQELRALQEKCSLPVATTTMGKGSVDESHPLSMGPIGYYMGKRGISRFMKPMVQDADVILLVGNRTNQNGTDGWTLLPEKANYIHIDIDPMEIGRNYQSLRVVGDAKFALAQLKEAMLKIGVSARKDARAELESKIAKAKADHVEDAKDAVTSNNSPIRIERFLAEVDKQLDDNHVIVADASFSSVWIANYTKAIKERKFIFPRGLAGLGWGAPMAMGAKVASPERKVFCLAGDGGFAHVWSELEACKREKINIVVAVINNEILGYQKHAERVLLGKCTTAVDLLPTDHAKIAEAVGIKGIRVEKAEDIAAAIKEAFAHDGPVVIDAMIDPNCIAPLPMMNPLELPI